MAFERRSYSGSGVSTTLATSIIAGDTTLSIVASTGWPTGGSGPFFLVIDRGTASEEVIKISSRSSLTLTVAASGRGSDGTTAASHTAGAAIDLCFTATDADEANAHYANTQTDPHPMYTTAAELAAYAQPIDATLTALAGANWAANALPIGSGADALSQITFGANSFPARASTGNLVAKTISDFILTLMDDADATTARATLGVSATSTSGNTVATSETTNSSSFTDLTTPGPAVTITTGTSALVIVTAFATSPTASLQASVMSYAVSGATTSAAVDTRALYVAASNTGGLNIMGMSRVFLHTGLTAGSNVFTAKYRTTNGANGTWQDRQIVVQAV